MQADIAEKVLSENKITNVKLIKKRSTELKIGIDMETRANILITETFDTELIGEGCIEIYNHAGNNLMEVELQYFFPIFKI